MEQYVMHKVDTIFDITDIITVYYLELAKDYVFEGEKHDFGKWYTLIKEKLL